MKNVVERIIKILYKNNVIVTPFIDGTVVSIKFIAEELVTEVIKDFTDFCVVNQRTTSTDGWDIWYIDNFKQDLKELLEQYKSERMGSR